MTREVPSASLRGQSAACAWSVTQRRCSAAAPSRIADFGAVDGRPYFSLHLSLPIGYCVQQQLRPVHHSCQTGEAQHGRKYRCCASRRDHAARSPSDARRGRPGPPGLRRGITRAIKAKDAAFLRDIVGELHEADLGDLIEALEADDRVEAGRTDRFGFRLLRAERGRRDRPRGDPRRTGTGGGCRGRPRAGIRRRRRNPGVARQGGPRGGSRKIVALGARGSRAQPRLSGKFRRPAHADRVHRGAAGLDRGAGDRLHARDQRVA